MTKKLFNSLSLVEQVNYFNEKLKEGLTITQICNEINISYNTVRDRFSRSFYTYNKICNKYECVENIFPLDEKVIERALENVVIKVFNNSNISQHETNKLNSNKLLIEPREDKTVNRSFRIYENVLDKFIDFCNKSNYNQYEILSKFIEDGICNFSN